MFISQNSLVYGFEAPSVFPRFFSQRAWQIGVFIRLHDIS